MNTTNTTERPTKTVPGPWGCQYRVSTSTVVMNVAASIWYALTDARGGSWPTPEVIHNTNVEEWLPQTAIWKSHGDASIVGFWFKQLQADPLHEGELMDIWSLLLDQAEWAVEMLTEDSPLDGFDGQL